MKFTERTQQILREIAAMSPQPLSHTDLVGALLDAATASGKEQLLDDLSFQAKFAYKTFGIMSRIGKDANGYDKLAREFSESIEKGKKLLAEIVERAPAETQKSVASQFLALTPEAFDRLMMLFRDLSWYKNYLIDSRKGL
ncbi:MAG: hypothetical protein HY961_18595 [Ignavibacteriae bacterium]|nr:hypothetical protein [Ignavibacteriota bacterium]